MGVALRGERTGREGMISSSTGDVRCGDVRCGDVRCGDVTCGDVRCGDVRCGDVRCGDVMGCRSGKSPLGISWRGGGREEEKEVVMSPLFSLSLSLSMCPLPFPGVGLSLGEVAGGNTADRELSFFKRGVVSLSPDSVNCRVDSVNCVESVEPCTG